MNSPVQQQNPTGPGNRQALQNASRRAERQGIPTISAQTLRAAIGSATSRTNFVHLLAEKDIETEFQTRGKAEEIYGYKVKIKGTKEWVSASTLAKDLSWPKIAHRFINDELETEPKSKMPPALKSILLPEQYGAKQIRPHAAHQTEVVLNPEKYNAQVVNLQIGAASKVMLLIGGLLAQVSVFLIQKILAFLKRLLAAFGFGMRQADLQKYEHPDKSAPALCYEPTQLSLPAPKSAEDKVADELFRVAQALETNDSSLLPIIDGEEGEKARAEVVSAMDDQGGKGTGATTAESENFGFTDEDFTSTIAVSEPSKTDPLVELKEALAAHEIAARELKVSEIKNGPIHFSSVDQRQAELKIVREDVQAARAKWDEFCTEHSLTWRIPSAEKTRLRQNVENNLVAEKRALKAVAAAEAEDARIKKLYETLPDAIVPAAILQAEAQSREAIKTAREAIQAEATDAIRAIRSDVMMSPKMAKFESMLDSSFKHFNRTGKISKDEFSVLNSQLSELRRLKSAQEAARRATMAEFDGDADKPVIDGQTVK